VSKNYQNLIIDFKVTVKNVGDAFLRHSVHLALNAKLVLTKLSYTGIEKQM